MELGSNFAAKLEPFLLMSKSAKGAAAAKLIQDATSAPGVFVFAELLDLPNIQEVNFQRWVKYIEDSTDKPCDLVEKKRTAHPFLFLVAIVLL